MKHRTITLAVVAALASLVLAGCPGDGQPAAPAPTPSPTPTEPTPTDPTPTPTDPTPTPTPTPTDPTPTPTPTQGALPKQTEPCPAGACEKGLSCVEYYGIAGARGPKFTSCEITCKGGATCPSGQTCRTIADGPGQVCRP
jgi:hypothetical protein